MITTIFCPGVIINFNGKVTTYLMTTDGTLFDTSQKTNRRKVGQAVTYFHTSEECQTFIYKQQLHLQVIKLHDEGGILLDNP